jgi:hypothetical protein
MPAKQRHVPQYRRALGNLDKWSYAGGLRSARALKLPQFLGIGAQKGGTTWLNRVLRCHPDLFVPAERKELHYFDWDWHRALTTYARNFRRAGERVRGEITPAYGVLPVERIRFIRRIMPDARLILLLRDPVPRTWSHALMHLVKRRGRAFEDVSEAEFLQFFERDPTRARSSYVRILDNWLSVFPEEQLYVGFFEQISEDPQQLLREIFTHVGVTADVDWSAIPYQEVVHRGVGKPMPEVCRQFLEDTYRDEIEELHRRFGARVAAWRRPAAPRREEVTTR